MANRRGRRNSKNQSSSGRVEMPTQDYSHMRLRYYIVRPDPNKTCVPMIALDELPKGFRLEGIPMTVTPQQIQEWDMARVGADIELKHSFEIEFDPQSLSQRGRQRASASKTPAISKEESEASKQASNDNPARDEEKGDNGVKVGASGHYNIQEQSEPDGVPELVQVKSEKDSTQKPNLQQQANDAANDFVEQSKWEKDNDRSKTQDAATPGVYGKKKFCTHWIRTGNCDYMQEGCRYLHVIPDAETRLRIGIRDMPRWAKEDLPSPPQERGRARRHSSTPPKMTKKDTNKDWRNRGNRKAHAELPAGPSSARPATTRPLTPTPQSSAQVKQHGLQRDMMQSQPILSADNDHSSRPAVPQAQQSIPFLAPTSHLAQQARNASRTHAIDPQAVHFAGAPAVSSSAQQPVQQNPTVQGSYTRQQHFSPLLSDSSPLASHSHLPPSYYSAPSFPNHGRFGYGSSTPANNYTAPPRSPLQQQQHQPPNIGLPFDPNDPRLDNKSRRPTPTHRPHDTIGHPYLAQPRPNHNHIPSPWFQQQQHSLLNSPTPSFSDSSIGTGIIGHGWGNLNSSRGGPLPAAQASPIPGPPIMHKRLFREPGESQYVQAQPEPLSASVVSSRNLGHGRGYKGKGMALFKRGEEGGGREGQGGNLIALDE